MGTGTQHASHVNRLIHEHAEHVFSTHLDEVVEAIMGEGHPDEDRIVAVFGRDAILTAEDEIFLADSVSAYIIANASRAHELLPMIMTLIGRQIGAHMWRQIPAFIVGLLDAAVWCEKNSQAYSERFDTELPIRLGMLLRLYMDGSPRGQRDPGEFPSEQIVTRFGELLAQYTSTENVSENTRRIAFIIGKAAEVSRDAHEGVKPFVLQVTLCASGFMSATALIKALNSEFNAERIIAA